MKKNKVFNIIFLVICFIFIISNFTLAKPNIDHIKDNVASGTSGHEIAFIGSIIYSIVTDIGVAIAVIVFAFIGIKYMLGSADERAEYKKSMIPYLIGASLLFGASGITKLAIKIVK